jgi:hypothetical protein
MPHDAPSMGVVRSLDWVSTILLAVPSCVALQDRIVTRRLLSIISNMVVRIRISNLLKAFPFVLTDMKNFTASSYKLILFHFGSV